MFSLRSFFRAMVGSSTRASICDTVSACSFGLDPPEEQNALRRSRQMQALYCQTTRGAIKRQVLHAAESAQPRHTDDKKQNDSSQYSIQ